MYTIDAYDAEHQLAWQTGVHHDRDRALSEAKRLARLWPVVEVRNPNELNPDNQPIAAWIHGERQF